MEVIVLGIGCVRCSSAYDVVAKVVEEMGLEVNLKKVEDVEEIIKYNIIATPAVVIDGEVVIKGYVPTEEQVRKVLSR